MTRISLFPLSLMLAGGLSALGGCDRQSAPGAQQLEMQSGTQAPEKSAAPEASGTGQAAAPDGKSANADLTGKLDRSHKGEAIPTYTFADISGKRAKLSDFKNKQPVLVNLWATWCAPCVKEMPMLDKLAGDYGDKLRVVTVSQDMTEAQAVGPFFKEKGFKHLPTWLDKNSDLAFYYSEAAVLPTTILYDKAGHEIWRVTGGYDWSSPAAKKLVDEAITTAGK